MANTNKYNRNLRDFGAYPYPGKNMPEYYDDLQNAGDGNPGVQYMIAHYVSMYGPYHVIEGCDVTTTSDQITGSTGWVMYSGAITEVSSEGRTTLSDGDWYIINQGGAYGSTGAKPTGVIIGRRVGSNIWDMRDRYDENSNRNFPNSVTHYAPIKTYNDITGNLDNISGYESVSANTGIFNEIKGFSDIGMQDSLDFKDTYHVKGASQITGISGTFGSQEVITANITNASITNATKDIDFGDTYGLKGVSQITGISGSIDDLIITKAPDSDDHATTKAHVDSFLDSFLGIGISNKRWANLILEGANQTNRVHRVNDFYVNTSGGSWAYHFGFPLPFVIGDKNLILTRTKIGIRQADANNKITTRSWQGWINCDTKSSAAYDTTQFDSIQEVIWDHDDATIGGVYIRLSFSIGVDLTDIGGLEISYAQAEYYYG